MEFGAHLPLIDFGDTRQSLMDLTTYARSAHELGYSTLCANDHLVFGRPWLDGPTSLAAVLPATGNMRLATTITVPILRGPMATAKILAAIDLLSAGRLTVAVGPGSSPRDYALVGIEFEERWKRLDESIQVLRAVWDSSQSEFNGEFYGTMGEKLEPLPSQKGGPPIWIGSWGSQAGLRRVVRLGDGWLASGYNTNPITFQKARMDLEAMLAEVGKSRSGFPNGIATMWSYVTTDSSVAVRLLEEVLAPMLRRDPGEIADLLPVGSPDHCVRVMQSYSDAGAERVFIWPISDEANQLEIFMNEVAGHVT